MVFKNRNAVLNTIFCKGPGNKRRRKRAFLRTENNINIGETGTLIKKGSDGQLKMLKGTPPTMAATIFSEGSWWIIVGIAVIAVVGVATLVIVKKKKKPALAEGENTDEE